MDTLSPVNAVLENINSKPEGTFSELLHLHDSQLEHESEGNHIGKCDVEEGNLRGGFELQETKLEIKCLKECSTFSYPSSSSDEETDASPSKQSTRQNYMCSVSLTAPPKLVSAMKGSREKEGGSQMKLTVKWAPDVYDPVPTLSSHTVKSKKQHKSRIQKSEKKNGKKANYSKRVSYRGKQYQYMWLHSRDEVFEASTELDGLNVANHASYFGIAYLKSSVKSVHWPIGEGC